MDMCHNDGHHSPVSPTFSFWPPYKEEEDNEEKRTVFVSYHAQSAATTPARIAEGNGMKISYHNSSQPKAVDKGGRGFAGLAAPGTPTTSMLTSSHKRPTDRPSALVSPLASLERSRSSNVRVSHLRMNPATVGAPRALLKKPPPPLPPPPSPQPIPRQKSHSQPHAHNSAKNAMACSDLYLQSPSGTSNKKSYTSSIHVHVNPVAPPITLDLREPTYQPNTASNSTSNALPQCSELQDSHPKRTHHLFTFSRCPLDLRYRELRCMEGVVFQSTPAKSTKLSVEKEAFTDTEVPLPSPRITLESCDKRREEVISRTKECTMWNTRDDVLTNDVTILKPHEEVFPFMRGTGNIIQHSKEMTNDTPSLSRLRVVSLREGRVCEIVRPFSPFHALISLENSQKASLRFHEPTNSRAVDSTPCIRLHESVVRHASLGQILSEPLADKSRNFPAPSPEPKFDIPPDRITTPQSPYLTENTVYFEALGSHSTAFCPEGSPLLNTKAEGVAVSPLKRDTTPTPKETMERINKLRSILRVDKKFYPLQVDKCVQVEQPARRTLDSWQISKECQVNQLPSDLWDTATISDTSTHSFNEHDDVVTNIVEDYGDCEPLPSFRGRPQPQENASFPLLMMRQEHRLRKPSSKFVRRRRRTKIPTVKMEDERDAEITSGAPFVASRAIRSMSVDERRCLPSAEQGSTFSANEFSPPVSATTSATRWEECINRVYARRRYHSVSNNTHIQSSRPKQTSRKSCTNDRKRLQDLRCSLMRQTFASAQRCKASQPN
uniref:Uncharacterized protein n=1 Tax=Echinococcus granulosus TaxID=6210 RepID=A0A068WS72_ECHGR|nr:hypothetical protein EgrG_001121000 [Echinococcus granulosus]